MRRHGLILAALAVLSVLPGALLAGCSSPDLPDLPDDPARKEEPKPAAPGSIEVAASDPGALTPAKDGDAILPGLVLLEPVLAEGGVATFSVRNDTGGDLPDLILSVVFAVAPAGKKGPVIPRFESLEAPLRAGETRHLRATLSSQLLGEAPASFRVAAGLPEILAAHENAEPGARSGTTFLGGRLECVGLQVDLTSVHRTVTVDLAESGSGGGELKTLEAQLMFGRAGELVWTGPWILVPRAGAEGARERRIQWNLDGAPGLTACDLYLRVREKR